MSGGPGVLRIARVEDAQAIVNLRDAAARWQQARGVVQWSPGEVGLSEVRAQCGLAEWWVLEREFGGVTAAVRVLDRDPAVWSDGVPAGYVHGLVIDRREAGRGVGAGLLRDAEEVVRRRGVGRVRLDCVESNSALRAWYRLRGYVEAGRVDFGPNSSWHPVMRFEKLLGDQGDVRRG